MQPEVSTVQSASTRFQGSNPSSFKNVSGSSTVGAENLTPESKKLDSDLRPEMKILIKTLIVNQQEQAFAQLVKLDLLKNNCKNGLVKLDSHACDSIMSKLGGG
jgi:hypothetical protein